MQENSKPQGDNNPPPGADNIGAIICIIFAGLIMLAVWMPLILTVRSTINK
jgi:hypothetical protein